MGAQVGMAVLGGEAQGLDGGLLYGVPMTNQHTPKSRARKLIVKFNAERDYTRDHLFIDIAREIEDAEKRGYDCGYTDAHDGKMYRQRSPGAVED
jgi:hypothetical protein